MTTNPDRPIPKANTGSALLNAFAALSINLVQLERRFDPFFRPAFDAMLRDPLARFVTALINRKRTDDDLKIAEEKLQPDEEAYLDSIIASFHTQLHDLWKPGAFERGGNTKTHGIVRGEFIVHDDLPPELRHGIYATPQTYRAWVRFSGPGPYITPDIDDVGFMSISIKLMGVPGPKLMEEEKFTQDMFGVSTPTFVTPDTKANAQLQIESFKNAQIFYFVNLHRSHVLDLIMQSLWIKTQSSPFEAPYFSCVPYLLGEGQAMQYSVWPRDSARRRYRDSRCALLTTICATPWSLLSRRRMSNSIFACSFKRILPHAHRKQRRALAGEASPRRSGGHPAHSPADVQFAGAARFCPAALLQSLALHSRASPARQPEPRPAPNVRHALRLRHTMNDVPLYEPTGDEVFE